MRKMTATLSAIALLVALAIPAMAQPPGTSGFTKVNPNGKSVVLADGAITINDNNKGGPNCVYTIVNNDASGPFTLWAKIKSDWVNVSGQTSITGVNELWYSFVFDPCYFGHDWVEITVDPTCTLQGYTTMVCANGCDEVWGFWWDYTDALGHDFQDYNWDGFGWWASGCSRCDWEGYISYDPCFFGHDWVETIVEPTCTLMGYTTNVCANGCDEVWGYWWDYTDALGHTWASVEWDGYGWLAVCDVCGWQGYITCGTDGFFCGEICDECGECTGCTCEGHATFLDKLNEAAVGLQYSNAPITVTVDGVAYKFTSNSGNYYKVA